MPAVKTNIALGEDRCDLAEHGNIASISAREHCQAQPLHNISINQPQPAATNKQTFALPMTKNLTSDKSKNSQVIPLPKRYQNP
jgi:hypothetical protein